MPLSNELSSATGPRGVSLLKRTQTPCSKSEIMKGQAGYRSVEHLSVQNQQSDSQPLLDSSYLVTVTLVSLNPNLAVHLPLSTFTHAYSSITFSHSFRILYTMDTASFFLLLLVDERSVRQRLQQPSNTADFLISGPFGRRSSEALWMSFLCFSD